VAHEKAYFVAVAQVGSPWMLVHRANDKTLAQLVADGQPDGSGFVVEVSRNTDPGLAGGMEAEVRHQAEQLEGEEMRRQRREATGGSMTEDQRKAEDKESGAATARRAADLVEEGDRAVEAAAAKTENRGSGSDQSNVLRPDPNAEPSKEDQEAAAKKQPTTTTKPPTKK
jgi:hypothetical protein